MRHPPKSKEHGQKPPIEMISIGKSAAFAHTSSTLFIFKGCFNPHTHCILSYSLMVGFPVRNQKPGFLVSGFPTRTEPDFHLMLLPQQYLPIPRFSFFFYYMLALHPTLIIMAKFL